PDSPPCFVSENPMLVAQIFLDVPFYHGPDGSGGRRSRRPDDPSVSIVAADRALGYPCRASGPSGGRGGFVCARRSRRMMRTAGRARSSRRVGGGCRRGPSSPGDGRFESRSLFRVGGSRILSRG